MTPRANYTLTLESLPAGDREAPAIVRLRRLLKACGRGYGFRVRAVLPAEVPDDGVAPRPVSSAPARPDGAQAPTGGPDKGTQ